MEQPCSGTVVPIKSMRLTVGHSSTTWESYEAGFGGTSVRAANTGGIIAMRESERNLPWSRGNALPQKQTGGDAPKHTRIAFLCDLSFGQSWAGY